jgi:hypothetical protein
MRTPFLGGAYISQSLAMSVQQCINLYLEVVETKDGKEPAALLGVPGKRFVAAVGAGPIRGAYALGSTAFVVSGAVLYSISAGFVAVAVGTLNTSTGPVSLAYSGSQLAVADGTALYGYDTNSAFFQQITAPFTDGSRSVIYQDGYFLADQAGSQKIWQSNINDVFTWDGLNFSSADAAPDNVIALLEFQRQVFIIGEASIEVWVNAGAQGFAFQRLTGPFIEQGCVAPASAVATDSGIVWLGRNELGQGSVWFCSAYSPEKISTHAIERTIQSYPTITDAVGYAYESNGHSFYVLNFPSGNATWVYDFNTGYWHQRAAFANGAFSRDIGNCFMAYAGQLVVGDANNGNLYTLNEDEYTDAGAPLKWLRTWSALPPGKNDYNRARFDSLLIIAEVGVGNGLVENPQGVLRYSRDGGHNWSQELFATLGPVGASRTRARWRRLSVARDMAFEFSGTDPVKRCFVGADLTAQAGAS